MTIGIIGLGEIGGNLAAWLAENGHDVHGYDIDPQAAERAASRGVKVAGSRAALIERCQIVATSLANLDAIEMTYFADDGLIAKHRSGLVTLECSTVPPEMARRITAARKNAGGVAVEAPVIGIGKDARAGQLYFLVAGTDADIDEASLFFDVAGRGWRHTGASGTAAIAKALNNGVGNATICAIAEAIALAEKNGISAATLVDIMHIGAGAGASVVLSRHGQSMANFADSTRPYNPIPLKDAKALGSLLESSPVDSLPMLATMIKTFVRDLGSSAIAAPERLAACALARVRAGDSQ